jgi:hypothetical protein
MKKTFFFALLIICTTDLISQTDSRIAHSAIPLSQVERYVMPPVDNEALLAEEMSRRAPGRAPKFAQSMEVAISPETHGTWEKISGEKEVWRLRIYSKGARSLNLGFTKYQMPRGGTLVLYSADKKQVIGPFSPADNEEHEQLWTPILEGEELVLEIVIPSTSKHALNLELQYVNHDYVGIKSALNGTGACHLDIVCGATDGWPQVDDYRDIIQSVGVISTGGATFCSGFLVSNTRNDCTPYFMTAHHCDIDLNNASSLVVYWNYQNSFCRQPGSAASGGSGNGSLSLFNTGAIWKAGWASSDFTLVELDDPLPLEANAFFAGWNRSQTYNEATYIGVHHPDGKEKRISFADTEPYQGAWGSGNTQVPGGNHVIIPDWNIGTTESGSSGSPLFDNNKLVIGQLHGGAANCSNDLYDSYGAFWASWNGGGTPFTRLKDWLDPDGSDPIAQNGYYEVCSDPCFGITHEEPTTTQEITGLVVWNTNQVITENIRIKTGGELRIISSVIEMYPYAKITVERGARLLIDGGEIKLLEDECVEPEEYWGGIAVVGNSSLEQPNDPLGVLDPNAAGILVMKNQAKLIDARHAISTSNPDCYYCWSDYGGLVDAQDSYFIDCYRSAEFMKYDFTNKSRFVNCTFSDNGIPNLGAVSIWDTDGVLFDNCTFDDMGYGILVYDAGCTVQNGCEFSSCGKGVEVRATMPLLSGSPVTIAPEGGNRNAFGPNNGIDIEVTSGDLYKAVEIFQNDFLGSSSDAVWIDGRSSVNISENIFAQEDFTVVFDHTDIGFIELNCNDFHQQSFLPVYVQGKNDRTLILSNQFNDNTFGNITINGDFGLSSIAPVQGLFGNNAAKNCFSTIADEHIWTFQNTSTFRYLFSGSPTSCEFPAQASYGTNNFIVTPGIDLGNICPFIDEEGVQDYGEYLERRNQYLNLYNQFQNDPGNVSLEAQVLEAERLKSIAIRSLLKQGLDSENTTIFEQVAALENNDSAWRLLIGLYLQLNDLTNASSTLNSLTVSDENNDFRTVQEINILRLQHQTAAFELTNLQKEQLTEIATGQSTERGHARALLSLLEGYIYWPIHDFVLPQQSQGVLPKSLISKNKDKQLLVYPNPTSGRLNIELPVYETETVYFEIFDISGVKLSKYTMKEGQSYTIDAASLSPGIYYIKAYTRNDTIGITRVAII